MVSRFNSVVLNRSVVRLFAYQKRLIYKKRFIKAEEMSSNGCSLLNRPKKIVSIMYYLLIWNIFMKIDILIKEN